MNSDPLPLPVRLHQVTALGLCLWLAGCGSPVLSARAFELAKAVDNLCNLEDAEQLDHAREIIASSAASGDITTSEAETLYVLLDFAAQGDWKTAQIRARQLLESQQNR